MKKSFRKIGKSVAATTMALSVLAMPLSWEAFAADSKKKVGKQEVDLRILGTTDIHTHLYNYDYYKDSESLEFGLAKTATLIKKAREEADNTLLFDNGDLIQGNPLGDYKAKVDTA